MAIRLANNTGGFLSVKLNHHLERRMRRRMELVATIIVFAVGVMPRTCLAQTWLSHLPASFRASVVVAKTDWQTKAQQIWLYRIRNRRVTATRLIVTFPQERGVHLSPSTRYLLSERVESINGPELLYSQDLARHGSETAVLRHKSPLYFLSWSPDGEVAMFYTLSDDRDAGMPTITLVDARSGTFCKLASQQRNIVLAAFWSRDRRHIVFETSGNIDSAPRHQSGRSDALESRAFYSITLNRNHGLSLGPQTRVTDRQIDAILGISFLPLIKAWEQESFLSQPYSFMFADILHISHDGRKAFLFGKGVHKSRPEWARPDKTITYLASGRRVKRFLSDGEAPWNVADWSTDERYISYFDSDVWYWLDLATGQTLGLQWPDAGIFPQPFLAELRD